MDTKELYTYRMNNSELQKWNQLQNRIIIDCSQVNVPLSFGEYIKTQTSPENPHEHTAGYCSTVGYFYIAEGDRGELFLKCLSQNCEDIRWYVVEKIFSYIGQQLELERRKEEEKNWRYPRSFVNGKLTFEDNKNWTYNAVYDGRKYWFEYVISSLAKIFDTDRIQPYVISRINLINRWFDVPHWDFSWGKMCFVEISDSKELN